MKSEVLKAAGSDSTPLFEHIEAGIYRYTLNGNYYERPTLNGKRTWRSLKTKNLKSARKKLRWRRCGIARSPRVQPEVFPRVDSELAIVGDVIHRYQEDGYLDKDLNHRPEAPVVTRNVIAQFSSSFGRTLKSARPLRLRATATMIGAFPVFSKAPVIAPSIVN